MTEWKDLDMVALMIFNEYVLSRIQLHQTGHRYVGLDVLRGLATLVLGLRESW